MLQGNYSLVIGTLLLLLVLVLVLLSLALLKLHLALSLVLGHVARHVVKVDGRAIVASKWHFTVWRRPCP